MFINIGIKPKSPFLFGVYLFCFSLKIDATSEIQTQNQNYNISCPNEQEFFSDGLCRDTGYELSLPSRSESNTILLNVRQFVVLEIDEKAKRMEVNVRFTMQWHDSRITVLPLASDNNKLKPITISHYNKQKSNDVWSSIWTPDSIIRYANIRRYTLAQDPFAFLSIISDERLDEYNPNNVTVLQVSRRMKISLICDFEFDMFPLDTQNCSVTWLNIGGINTFLKLSMVLVDPSGIKQCKEGFQIEATIKEGKLHNEEGIPYVELHFSMHRIWLIYLYQYYLPCASIVFVSHVSFVIPPSSIPGRLGLLATLFLTLTNIFINHLVTLSKLSIFMGLNLPALSHYRLTYLSVVFYQFIFRF